MKRELYEALAKLCAEHGSAGVVQALSDAFATAADVTESYEYNYRQAASRLLALGQHVAEFEANTATDAPSLAQAFEMLAEGEELEATLDQRHAEKEAGRG